MSLDSGQINLNQVNSNLRRVHGFSLLEVMVAVAILGLSLIVILSAQVGLFSSGSYG